MRIEPGGPVDAVIQAPPSKSLTIRALAAAALADGRSALRGPLRADDTRVMAEALRTLGIPVSLRGASFIVEGQAGRIPAAGAMLDLGHAGTPLRLLTVLCCLGRGRFVLDGSPRMRERPVQDLLSALSALGVTILSQRGNGCPPVELVASGFPGGRVSVRGAASSQYVSALLMAAPCGQRDLELSLDGPLVSRPYVDLTLSVMEAFGVSVRREEHRWFQVPAGQTYSPRVYPVEGDASSAAYFWAAAAITRGLVRVTGIPEGSSQADLMVLGLLERMGCRVAATEDGIEVMGGPLRGIEADLGDAPDLGPTLAMVAMFAEGATTLRGVSHLRLKESDRLEATAACVRALGAGADVGTGTLTVTPPSSGQSGLRGATIDPHDDHRLAMAFSVAGLAIPGVTILNPGCVSKSCPDFFERLAVLRS
ncbi:MAG: 3-phosphoshikimate 1-carboxyvinyltransferase [Candidatus Polarisedimenticolia bacterium]